MGGLQLFGAIVLFSTFGLIIFCFIMFTIIQSRRHFVCPECKYRFKPAPHNAFFSSRRGIEKMLTCPNCGLRTYMDNIADVEYNPNEDYEENLNVEDTIDDKKIEK